MRILLDECVPRRVRRALRDHDVTTVQELGWAGLGDLEMVTRIGARFHVLLTVDRKLATQLDTRRLPLAIVLLVGRSNRYADLAPLLGRVLCLLTICQPGEMYTVADFQMGEIVRESAPAYQSVSGAAKRAFRVPQRDLLGTGAA